MIRIQQHAAPVSLAVQLMLAGLAYYVTDQLACGYALAAAPDVARTLRSGLRTTDNFSLASVLDRASAEALAFGEATSFPMKYGISSGESSLRSLSDDDMDLLRPSKYGAFGEHISDSASFHRAASIMLLLRGNLEASHEVVLGVTPVDIEQGEYAAMHPGQTSWADNHPLSTAADIIHAAIHRLEGAAYGEGNHTGYDNAKYWAMGGPKKLENPAPHPAREKLACRAMEYAPCCIAKGVIAGDGEDGLGPIHCIIAGGGEIRHVRVPPGEWDDIRFIDICRLRSEGELTPEESTEVADLQRAEMIFLLKNELQMAGFGVGSDPC